MSAWELESAELSYKSFVGTFYEAQMVAYMPLERSQIDLSRLKKIEIFRFFWTPKRANQRANLAIWVPF